MAAGPFGLTQHNLTPHTHAAARLLGQTHELGRPLGLPEDWPRTVLETTGNLQEIYSRTLPFTPSQPPSASPFK